MTSMALSNFKPHQPQSEHSFEANYSWTKVARLAGLVRATRCMPSAATADLSASTTRTLAQSDDRITPRTSHDALAEDLQPLPAAHLVSSAPNAAASLSSGSNIRPVARPGLPKRSPSYVETLTRASVPASSISGQSAKFPEILAPRAELASSSTIGSLTGSTRSRSASASSLKSVLQRRTSSQSLKNSSRSPSRHNSVTSSSSILDKPLPPIADTGVNEEPTSETERDAKSALSQLSWNTKWWPFAVVAPDAKNKGKTKAVEEEVADGDGAGLPQPSTSPGKHQTGWMSIFAGKQAANEAQAHLEQQQRQDLDEQRLLEADLETFTRATTDGQDQAGKSEQSNSNGEADTSPRTLGSSVSASPIQQQRSMAKSDSPSAAAAAASTAGTNEPNRSATSFLPTSIFSSSSSSTAGPLDGPSSLFSSLSIPNPFATSSSPPSKPRIHRHYSTSSGKNKDEGPTARRREVQEYLDDQDSKTAQKEDDSHMEIFSMIKERYRCPKLPIVFCHGLFGFDVLGPASLKPLQFSYWVGVKEALEAMGAEVLIGRVPASASIEERAKVLCELIEKTFPGREVNLIGHSMGGLDGRFLISRLQPTTFKVRSLTTISTPHRGSSFADYLLEDVLGPKNVPALLSMMETLGVPGGGKAFDDLTVTKMARFNDETPDDPNVNYYSYSAEFEPSWSNVFRVPWGIIHEKEGANDGLVSVTSAKWGVHKATLTNVNHLDLIGMIGKVRFGWASMLGNPIKFRPISFFCAIAEDLADNGF
ncbi:lipase 2 [Microbotryomycetes sp. JL221]|nr:lipase 2 [Microbotryomycetes sp. JL221]